MAARMLNRAPFIAPCLAVLLAVAFVPEVMGQTPLAAASSMERPEWVKGIYYALLLTLLLTVAGILAGALWDAYTARYRLETDRFVGGWLWRLGLAFGLSGVIVVALDAAWPVWVSP